MQVRINKIAVENGNFFVNINTKNIVISTKRMLKILIFLNFTFGLLSFLYLKYIHGNSLIISEDIFNLLINY